MVSVSGFEEVVEPPALPPSPPDVLPDMETEQIALPTYSIISRPGVGTTGKRIALLVNLFKVAADATDATFFQYSVTITSEDKRVIENKGIGRKLIDKLHQTYSSELGGKSFVYDGDRTLYTVGPLPDNKFEFTVLLEESFAKHSSTECPGADGSPHGENKRSKRSFPPKAFTVEISFSAKIPLQSIALSLKGIESYANSQDALRVLDTILRQRAANRGCLLVRQSFFHDDSKNFIDVGGGVTGVRGFHSSFRLTQGGLSLNMDVSTTMIVKPGPVIDFLLTNQSVREPRYIDWAKAKRMLKNLRVRATHRNQEFKISGLSEKPCIQQLFSLKMKNGEDSNAEKTVDVTVYEYFAKHRGIELTSSAYLPCLDVGKPNRPIFLPLELCSLLPLQRYTKALSPVQRASLVEKSRQKPQERIKILTNAIGNSCYDDDAVLTACGISIDKQFTPVEGRVLETPKLKVGKNEDCFPNNGRWNFKNKTLLQPSHIEYWAVVNFSAQCDTSYITRELIKCGMSKGINIERPFTLIEEEAQMRKSNPVARVEKMFELLISKLTKRPKLILCVLPERKNCNIYGPWKRKCLSEIGVVTQCISPLKITDQYLTNVLLKINSKLGGINSLLAIEHSGNLTLLKDTPTMILGMDVSHGSPGRSDIPSIAAVVGSRCWPLISRYRASVRSQSPKVEMIDALFKPLGDGIDDGIIRELLLDFYHTSNHKPTQIILFRDGVSESQFQQVLNIELNQIIKAYKYIDGVDVPKFTVIVAQKNHHIKLFQANALENVPPGTVVDTKIVHPRNYDFYMCTHAGMIGTSRPVHYHVLLDEIGFSPDGLQNLINSLAYVNQRSTTATSIVAPICYAHHAAAQMRQFLNFDELSEASLSPDSEGNIPIPELPRLHTDVNTSMFFC
ncbi:protein argonaute 16 isoform X1 [Trifolium pratense]|uniref:protein argonaute 16 isoform X1 n=1 Tax=Trifolium pratense TaxID=57577 RepID=UPI001E69412D|nr:protein argonaute 16 isoform X1 [Trifolium pratense]XP_045814113.1 protein argonaute 16 isoform X1 [Trifolium pratense]XP_045814114.1 protein argonaute 16 isoform X1 [Trifolium pratense]XP_045814115.1 protein argonaute 16 isoform X1 [Trifolium pratense]XP_045814116.1 protein argonaute 16 isoform X1 [Trifolium pratense]